ncbi:MAG: hypothetical protein JST22_15240 [Bacteroidetes bacterium]|nr:hypothetical protein [Bacteroidota bacterium]
MKNIALVTLACGALLASCGGKVSEMKQSIDNLQEVAKAGEKMQQAQDQAKKVYDERRAKGDTVAMPYKDLQGYLPTSIAGFKPAGDPSGSQQSMPGYSVSVAQQDWVGENDGKKLTVIVSDYGGTEAAYGLASVAWSMNLSQEDDNQKVHTEKFDDNGSGGVVTYNKKDHQVNIVSGTRYRYGVTTTLTGATDDQTAMVTDLTKGILKKFDGK